MKRMLFTLMVGLTLTAAALADEASGIAEAFKKAQAHFTARPKGGPEAQAWLAKAKELFLTLCEAWEGKAQGADELYLAKAHINMVSLDGENNIEHFKKAKGFCEGCLKARPDDADAKEILARVNGVLNQVEASAEAEKKRQALVGKPAPALAIEAVLEGEKPTLEGLKGKVVIIDFWATWYPPCRAAIPHLVELKKKHKDLAIIGLTRLYTYGAIPGVNNKVEQQQNLNAEQEQQLNRRFAQALEINYPIAFSTNAMSSYLASSIPLVVIIDRKGIVRYLRSGLSNEIALDKVVAECLAESAD